MSGFDVEFKNMLKMPVPWRMTLAGFGECLPYHSNYVEVNKDKVDAWGIPTLTINCKWEENEKKMSRDIAVQAAEILAASGAKEIGVFSDMTSPGLGIHEMGTARMGRDPKTSVLNAHNQVHDVPNVFMKDGPCMTSAAWLILPLTYIEITAPAGDYGLSTM